MIQEELKINGKVVDVAKLSRADGTDIKKVTKFLVDTLRRRRTIWRKELDHWQQGRLARYNVDMPRTYLLQDVFEDIMLDGHLTGITGDRTLRTTNKDYVFMRAGKIDDKLTAFIKDKEWFEHTLEIAHQSTYFGYSLIFINGVSNGEITSVDQIPRGLVVPERKALLDDYSSTKGIDYTSMPNILLFAQFYDPVGLLEKAAPYAILKRHSWGSWDEFEELYGIPIRIAKIASQSKTVKDEVAGWLEEMGSSAYGVFPIGTEIELKENAKTDAFNVFFQKLKAANDELSKIVIHQTMTVDQGSSRSQGEVHERTLEEVIYADEKKMLSFLNNRLVPAMRALGYAIPDDAVIAVLQTTDPDRQIVIDSQLMTAGYILTKDYIERTYGVEVERMPQSGGLSLGKPKGLLELNYDRCSCGCGGPVGGHIRLSKGEEEKLAGIVEKYLRELFDEMAISAETRLQLFNFYYSKLSEALNKGYNAKLAFYDEGLASSLKANIAEFSAFKETAFRKDLHTLLTDGDGIRQWSKFKQDASVVSDNYNRNHLKVEYDNTVANANVARKWAKFQAQKSVYQNLTFYTVGDGNVRPSHAAWDGYTAPVDDPVWNQLMIPLDWGCRCGIKQTNKEVTSAEPNGDIPDEFANNPGKTGVIYNDAHPYIKSASAAEKEEVQKFVQDNLK
ncbi:MAG: DUF935 family protein [Mangrovibacterium sp.]